MKYYSIIRLGSSSRVLNTYKRIFSFSLIFLSCLAQYSSACNKAFLFLIGSFDKHAKCALASIKSRSFKSKSSFCFTLKAVAVAEKASCAKAKASCSKAKALSGAEKSTEGNPGKSVKACSKSKTSCSKAKKACSASKVKA